MSDFSYLQTAKITEVVDSRTGLVLNAEKVVGDNDYAIGLRTTILENIENGTPIYLCSSCLKPIYLRSNPEKTGQYFVHRDVDENCPKLEARGANEDQIRAIRYNGAKESFAHIETKELLFECLKADRKFSNEIKESNWYSESDGRKFRRPDVQAIYDAGTTKMRIAFEIQLSATFLSEIVQRREFYRKEGALLVWVFRNFVEHDPRLTQLDIFYPNNLNAFVVNHKTRDISIEHKQLFFQCNYASPIIDRGSIKKIFKEQFVAFDSLSLDRSTQQAYFFDYKSALIEIEKDLQKIKLNATLNELKEYAKIQRWRLGDPTIVRIKQQLDRYSIRLPSHYDKLHRLINSIISLEVGKVVGFNFDNLIQYGNLLYDRSPEHIFFYLVASKTFGRIKLIESKGDRESWVNKKANVWKELKKLGKNSKYWWGSEMENFILLLFPQIKEDFLELKSRIPMLSKH